ncbi:MAG: glycosyltransferase family 4 protein [Planctomycetota bacterium]
MRLAFDCSHHLVPGGVRVYIQNLLAAWTQAEPEHELILHYRTPQRPTEIPSLPGITPSALVHCGLPRKWLSRVENLIGWPAIETWTGPIDVFHSPHFWLPPTRRARRVLSVHDVAYLRHPEYYAQRDLNDYGYHYLLPRSLRRAEAVIVPCEHTRRDLIELLAVPDERIWVVPFGSDPRFAAASADERARVRERYGLRDRPIVVYPAGTFDVRKNVPRVLRAFAQAFPSPSRRPLLFLSGVGAPPADVLRSIDELHLQDDVRIAQVEYPSELVALLSLAEWGLYPSLYEGFGIPALEMLHCGVPLIASSVSSVPEVVGDAAWLVDPHSVDQITDAMRTLHEDTALRADLQRRGRERAGSAAWTWERAAQQTHAAYLGDREAYRRLPNPLRTAAGVRAPVGAECTPASAAG